MSNSSGIIEINGHRYNVNSGRRVSSKKTDVRQSFKGAPAKTLDGVIKGTRAALGERKPSTPRNRKPANTVHNQPQRSKTLMRKIVSKPVPSKKPSHDKLDFKARSGRVRPATHFRAKQTARSPKVKHFGLAAVSAPRTDVSKRPTKKKMEILPGSGPFGGSAAAIAKPLSTAADSLSHQQLERLLDHALTRADAHKKMIEGKYGHRGLWRRIKKTPKWLSVGISALVLLTVGGYFAMRDVPQVSMKLAATRAHINASMPAYTPSGYSFIGPVSYHNGTITVKYSASGSNDSYSLTQKASNWDSQSLVANVVPKTAQVQTSQIRGTTVYIYGSSNNAAWVNNGILYSLKDKASLNSEQILKIADSL